MSGRVFIDSNILVYAYDASEPSKREIAQQVLRDAVRDGNGVISTQVLGEFLNVVTRKILVPMKISEARTVIGILSILPVVGIDLSLVERAVDTCESYQVSYWDALILAAAERASCAEVLSEDLGDGQSYRGVRVRNPFAS